MTTSNNSLASLLAPSNSTASATATTTKRGIKPIGNINIKVAGITLFNRSVWKESTSETAFLNELNALAQTDPNAAIKAIITLLSKAEVDISTKQTSDASLEEMLAS